MIDEDKLKSKIEGLKSNLIHGACSSQIAMETCCKEEAYNEVLTILNSMQKESNLSNMEKTRKDWKEEPARGVLRGKLKKLEEWRGNEWDLLRGCEEYAVIAYKLTSKEDVDTVMQAFLLDNPYYLDESNNKVNGWLAEKQAMAERAYRENDLLLMGTNCDGDLYFLDTRNAFIERFNNLDKKEKKDDTEGENHGA